jgi:uncharacterized membrane protein YjfL (UPF0719 family)
MIIAVALVDSLLHSVAYTVIGMALLVAGFWLLDLATPGDLRAAVFRNHARDASVVASAHMLATALVIAAAIQSSDDRFSDGIVSAAAHGLLGIVLLTLAVILADILTPGNFRESLTDDDPGLSGGSIVVAGVEIAVALIIAVSIS